MGKYEGAKGRHRFGNFEFFVQTCRWIAYGFESCRKNDFGKILQEVYTRIAYRRKTFGKNKLGYNVVS